MAHRTTFLLRSMHPEVRWPVISGVLDGKIPEVQQATLTRGTLGWDSGALYRNPKWAPKRCCGWGRGSYVLGERSTILPGSKSHNGYETHKLE